MNMNMFLRPLGDRIVIQPEELPEKTSAGIVLPHGAKKEGAVKAEVLAVGPDVKAIKVGDTAVLSEYQGKPYYEGEGEDMERFLILRETDVYAIYEKPKDKEGDSE
jgi:chaperonin GroES